MDNVKEWTYLPVPESLTSAFCRKDWKRISAESSVVFPRRPSQSRDWTEVTVFSLRLCDVYCVHMCNLFCGLSYFCDLSCPVMFLVWPFLVICSVLSSLSYVLWLLLQLNFDFSHVLQLVRVFLCVICPILEICPECCFILCFVIFFCYGLSFILWFSLCLICPTFFDMPYDVWFSYALWLILMFCDL